MVVSAPPSDGLLLRLVGEFAVLRAGAALPAPTVGSRKARALLKLLGVERDRWVHLDRIVDVLWAGEAAPRQPADNVATLVSRLRAALGGAVVEGGREGYRLGQPPAVEVDLAQARRHVTEANRRAAAGEAALCSAAAGRALSLLDDGRALVADPDAEWAQPARTEAAALLRGARELAAEAALAVGDAALARDLATAATTTDGYDEQAHRLLMRAEVALGQPARALAAYERLRSLLATDLGVDPSGETREVHLAVLRQQAPPTQPPTQPVAHAGTGAPVPGSRGVFAGREGAVDRLTRSWTAAAAGTPGLVLITGEAGIGKTRLAEEVADLAERTGGTVLRARCYEAERSLFLQPIVEALGRHAATSSPALVRAAAGDRGGPVSALVPQIAAIVGQLPAPRERGEVARRHAYDAFTSYLCQLASTPVLLVLDDLQQAGLATVELLHFLVRQAGNARLLVVTTVRSEEGEAVQAALTGIGERVELGPLPAGAVAQLATAAGQAHLADGIVARTGGHTLFVVETLRALASGDPGIPESLHAAVLARVRRAGGQTGALLRAAAVLGSAIEPQILARMLDIAPAAATSRCEQALAARLLVVSGRAYEFANDLIREVLYQSMPVPTRVAYHRHAADIQSERPEWVGTHAAAAGDWSRASRAWLVAGEQANARVAFADAQMLLCQAIEAAERSGEVEVAGRAYLARGHAREALATFPAALADLETAAELARQTGDRRLEMMTLRELANDVPVALGIPVTECATILHNGLILAEELGDRAIETDMLGRLAVISSNRLHFVEALAYGQRAVRTARAIGDEYALALALDGLKTPYAYLGEVGQLGRVLAELGPLLRRHRDVWRLAWMVQEGAFAAVAAADWDAALAQLTEAHELNRRSGYVAHEGYFVGQLGWVHRLRGDLEQALAYGRLALELTGESTHAWWRSSACTQLARTLRATGDDAGALAQLRTARGYASQEGAEAYLLNCLASLAEITGDPAELAEADALLAGVRAPDGGAWILGAEAYLALGRAWLAAGDTQRARATVEPLLTAADRTGWRWIRDAAADLTAAHD